MLYLSTLTFGFLAAFIGMSLPGMVNMTGLALSLRRGKNTGFRYSLGAACAIFLQAYIAVAFAAFLSQNPQFFLFIRRMAIGLFLVLSGFFFYQARHPREVKGSNRRGAPLLLGFAVAGMNALNIPYYFTLGVSLKAEGLILLEPPFPYLFAAGAAIGAIGILSTYVSFAPFILKRANYLTRNLNYFLSGLFLLLALIQGVQLIMQ